MINLTDPCTQQFYQRNKHRRIYPLVENASKWFLSVCSLSRFVKMIKINMSDDRQIKATKVRQG